MLIQRALQHAYDAYKHTVVLILRAFTTRIRSKQCAVMERSMHDGSFDEIMLLPERLDDLVPNKSRVSLHIYDFAAVIM